MAIREARFAPAGYNDSMKRWGVILALLGLMPLSSLAQSGGFGKTETRQVRDAEGRVIITVPDKWNEKPLGGSQVLRVQAPGPYGGHDLIVVRESNQPDPVANRERYLSHDSSRYPGSTISRQDSPYFGYRLNDPAKNRVVVRAFLADGGDGLVLSVSSRYQYYDKFYAAQIEAVLVSATIGSGSVSTRPEAEGELRRIFDPEARVSLVAPGAWKSLGTEAAEELLLIALKGSRRGPRMLVRDWGGPTGAGLLLLRVSAQWKRAYGRITVTRLEGEPPRMLVKHRVPGSIDYITAFEAGGRGYTLMLTVREGAFEQYRTIADEVASSVAFSGGPYRPANSWPGDLELPCKKFALVHAAAADRTAAEAVVKDLMGFERPWGRVGIGAAKGAGPIHVVLAAADTFDDVSHRFGSPPASYDPVSCAVVVTAPPQAESEERAMWRGQLFAATTDAVLHRDLACETPPWLRSGLASCMNACGRSGKRTDAAHPVFVKRLQLKISGDMHKSLPEVEALTRAEFDTAETLDAATLAWGYVHLLLHGRSALSSHFKKWIKALVKAPAGDPPPFDRKKYVKDRDDLKRHVERAWGN